MLLTIENEVNMTRYLDLLILLGSLAGMMWGMLKLMLKDIHKDLAELKESYRKSDEKHSKAEERIDHLYQICIDMLKDKK